MFGLMGVARLAGQSAEAPTPPGPSADAILQEDGTSFFTLEDDSGSMLKE